MYRVDFIEGTGFEAEYIERSCEEIIAIAATFLYTEWKIAGAYKIITKENNSQLSEKVIEGDIQPLYADGVVYRENIPHYVTDITVIDNEDNRKTYTVGLIECGDKVILACICGSYLDILQADHIKECNDNDESLRGYNENLFNRESHFFLKCY